MKTSKLFLCSMIVLLFAGGACTRDVLAVSSESDALLEAKSKLISSSTKAVEGKLIVYFSEEAVSVVENAVLTRSGEVATRSGIEGVDEVLENIGVVSLKRVFPVNPKTEERTREAGLHRWYRLEFDSDVNLDEAALALAAYSEVSRVQFCTKIERVVPEVESEVDGASLSGFSVTKSSTSTFNDPSLALQWNLINSGNTNIYSGIKEGADVRCEDAWRICAGDPRIIVAIVDDAIQYNHPDLAANMWVNSGEIDGDNADNDGNGYVDDVYGYSFLHDSPVNVSTESDGYHGCHVAGIVAAVNNNGVGVCGVAGGTGNNDGVRLMSCQVFYGSDYCEPDQIAEAFKYAADNGASILQCSFGYGIDDYNSDEEFKTYLSVEYEALMYFIGTSNCDALEGGLVLFASGNDFTARAVYPAAYEEFIAVSAISCDYTPACYTNYGYGCNVSAPGGDPYQSYIEDLHSEKTAVYSTSNNNRYTYASGTSMACPHASGVAALGLSYALQLGKTFTLDEFKSLFFASVYGIDEYCTGTKQYYNDGVITDLNLALYAGRMGAGALDAYRMLMNVRGTTCIPVSNNSQTVVDLTDYIGGGSGATFELISATISDEDKASLGMSSDPVFTGNRLLVNCTKTGSGIINLTLRYGTSGYDRNGMTVTQEFALVARASHSSNGGWL